MASKGERAGETDDYLLVAAIDFGTTFSGYALSFRNSPEEIRVNKNWGEILGFQSFKAPTSVLTTRSGEFVAFGYEAEEKYCGAVEDDEKTSDLMLFRHFKMMLYNKKNVKRKALTASVDGTIRPAVDVFVHALEYLKQHLLKTLKDEKGREIASSRIRWVITVPAIWGNEAKQFMREAAYKAGFIESKYSRQLLIALEPEAASLCCRRLEIAEYTDSEEIGFPAGTKYIVLDCGGGTIDITAHITQEGEKVKELTVPTGGPWGGTQVDQNFIDLLGSVLGVNFVQRFRSEFPTEWLTFMTNFERVKKAFRLDGTSKLRIPLSWSMFNLYSMLNKGKTIDGALKGASEKGVTFASGSLVIKPEASKKLFDPVIDKIVEHLRGFIKSPELSGLDYIFMVGGFSECQVLQEDVKAAFGGNGLKILIPNSAQLAVLKGAVLFGHKPLEISVRRAKYTYGIAVTRPFDERKHDRKYKYTNKDGVELCDKIFDVYIEKGEEIEVGHRIVKESRGLTHKEGGTFSIHYIAMDDKPNKPVQYMDDPRVSVCGRVPLDGLYEKPAHMCSTPPFTEVIEFGGTEFIVEIIDDATGATKTTASIDFLSD